MKLLQISAAFGVITNYSNTSLQVTAGITNYDVITNYVVITTVALTLVKDELCSVGGLSNFKITKSFLQSIKGSYTCYQAYLEAEKKVKVDQERKEKKEEQKEQEKEQ